MKYGFFFTLLIKNSSNGSVWAARVRVKAVQQWRKTIWCCAESSDDCLLMLAQPSVLSILPLGNSELSWVTTETSKRHRSDFAKTPVAPDKHFLTSWSQQPPMPAWQHFRHPQTKPWQKQLTTHRCRVKGAAGKYWVYCFRQSQHTGHLITFSHVRQTYNNKQQK